MEPAREKVRLDTAIKEGKALHRPAREPLEPSDPPRGEAVKALLTRHPAAKYRAGGFEITLDWKIGPKTAVGIGQRLVAATQALADGYRGARARLAGVARGAADPGVRRRAADVLWRAFPDSAEGAALAQEWAAGDDLELAVLGARALGDEAREAALMARIEGARGGLEVVAAGEGGHLSVAEEEAGRLSEAPPTRRRERSKK